MIHTVRMPDGFLCKMLDLKLTLNYIISMSIKAIESRKEQRYDLQRF